MSDRLLVGFLFPEGLLDYFDVTNAEKQGGTYYFHLEEKNIKPEQFKDNKLNSNGFHPPVTIQDFPLRGKACYLLFKPERKWTPTQRHRAEILFKYYPDIEKAYSLCRDLGRIYERPKTKGVAFTKLA